MDDRLSATGEADRQMLFLKAAETDNVELLSAILTALVMPLIGDEVKTRALTEQAKRLQAERYAALRQNELLSEYLTSLRDMTALWLRGLGVEPKKISDTLGGEMTYLLGNPVGKEKLTGAAWAQAIAAGA